MRRDPKASGRVLWLLNHSTLRECEVVLLREMGFEVFTPKRFPRNSDNRSASVTFDFDDSLSLPSDIVAELNAHDFYRFGMSPRISFLINHYFETAIVAYMFPILDTIVTRFKGRILLRAFGLTHPTWTYYSFANEVIGPTFQRRLAKVSNRFWFASGYPNLPEIEPPFIKERSVLLPVGLSGRILKNAGTWTGGDARLLFVCPDIKTYDDSREVYDAFKQNFGDLPHIICGSQTVPVTDDPSVAGKVSAQEFDRLFRECAAMFYHSRLPRHIHYHPVEAACYGMPLVYMTEGMLGTLGGKTLPGAAATMAEARRKVDCLRDPVEVEFRNSVISAQSRILEYFLPSHTEALWRENFLGKVTATPLPPSKPLKIAVLTFDTSPGTLRLAAYTAESLVELELAEPDRINVVLGIVRVEGQDYRPEHPETFTVRPFEWSKVPSEKIEIAQRLLGHDVRIEPGTYAVPEDDISQFMDCDAWLMVGNPTFEAVAPLKPLAHLPLPSQGNSHQLGTKLQDRNAARHEYGLNLRQMRAIFDLEGSTEGDRMRRELGISHDLFVKLPSRLGNDGRKRPAARVIVETIEAIV